MKENYFKSLTGLRFIAASMVYFLHFNPLSTKETFGGIINEFHTGVTIFFVLSGFLISYRYGGIKIEYKKYFVNRFARIYPVFFLFTLITYIINPVKSPVEVFLNFTLLKAFFTKYLFTGITQGWTLTVEESFYAFALILFLLRKYKYYIFIAILPIILFALGLLFQNFFSINDFRGFLATKDLVITFTFFGRSLEFISGFLLGCFITKIKTSYKYFTATGVLMIVFMWYLMSFFRGYEITSINTIEGKIINNVFLPLFGIIPLIIGLVKEKTFLSKFLELDFIEFLGKSSYTFYIIHMGVIHEIINNYTQNVFIVYCLLLVISCFIFKYFEEPSNKFLKNILIKK